MLIKVWIRDDILQCASQVCSELSCNRFNECENASDFVLKLKSQKILEEWQQLKEKQTHKIPCVEARTSSDGNYYHEICCPVCNNYIGYGEDEDDDGAIEYNVDNYCSNCGQRIEDDSRKWR